MGAKTGEKHWKPGQSGNPAGRPKGAKVPKSVDDVTRLARGATRQAIAVLVRAMDSSDLRIASAAANAILDRGWGKPAQAMALTGKDGEALSVVVNVIQKQ